jgi:hypothetical protein
VKRSKARKRFGAKRQNKIQRTFRAEAAHAPKRVPQERANVKRVESSQAVWSEATKQKDQHVRFGCADLLRSAIEFVRFKNVVQSWFVFPQACPVARRKK